MEKADLYKLKKDINLLRSNLNSLNLTKREKLKEIQKIRSEIREVLNKVNEFKNKKNTFSAELEELKKQRDSHNTNVKNLVSALKALNIQTKEVEKKFKINYNPLALKEKIDKIEIKIQTEVISFEKEKKLMAEIRKLKTDFKNSGELFVIQEKIEKLSKDIREEREKANSYHNKIKEILNCNKEENKGFKDLFRQLDKLRKSQEDKQKEVDEINKNSENLSLELNTNLIEIGKINPSFRESNKKEARKKEEERIIEEKSKIVEEKIKNRVKLTTEDLIVMQGKLKNEQ